MVEASGLFTDLAVSKRPPLVRLVGEWALSDGPLEDHRPSTRRFITLEEKPMGTYGIRHEVGIKASPEAVYEAVTQVPKLAAWWTSDTRGSGAKVGDVLEFWFGDFCQKFEVVELHPGELVRWKATKK